MDAGRDLAQVLAGAEARSRFQQRLLDAVGEAVIAVDLEGRILFWNPAAERLYGWHADEVLGRHIVDVTPSISARTEAHAIMERLLEGETWSGEVQVRRKDGTVFHARVNATPIFDDAGQLIAIAGVSSDATPLREEKERQRFLARATGVLSESLDEDASLHALSELAVPAVADWCFVVRIEPDGARLLPLSHHADPAKAAAARSLLRSHPPAGSAPTAAALKGEPALVSDLSPRVLQRFVQDAEHAAAIGRLGIRSVMAAPVTAHGQTLGSITLASDTPGRYARRDLDMLVEIGRRAGAAIENARLYRASTEANEAKANFLAIVSHELRTPLNAITGYTDLLADGIAGPLAEQQRHYLTRIKSSADLLVHIINEILTYARLEGGREHVRVSDVDAAEIARDIAREVAHAAGTRGLELRVQATEAGVPLRTDADKARQILSNLAGNAVKFTERGFVEIGARAEGAGAVLWVRDSGPGIDVEHRDAVFEPFWQAEPANTRAAGGTGLGLSVVSRLARLLGGELRLETEVGHGSRFEVRLPSLQPGLRRSSGS